MNRQVRHSWRCLGIVAALATSGCERVPAFNLLGSYFPSWIVCSAAGVATTLLAHVMFVRLRFVSQMWPLAIIYPALACFVTCSLWLIFFN